MPRTILITNDYPPVVSGISTVYHQVWKRLDSETHWILTPAVKGGADFDRGESSKVIRHPKFSGTGRLAKTLNALTQMIWVKWLVMFRGVRMIHAGQIWISGTIGWLMKVFFGVPYILWVYGGETLPVYMKGRFTTFWARTLLKGARQIVANSEFCRQEFLDYGFPQAKVPIVLPGVDPSVFTPGAAPESLIAKWNPEGKNILLTVARVSERKGHDLVIKSLSELLKKHPQTFYLIVGKGPDRERLQSLSEVLGVSDAVGFAGFVPDEELPDYYRLCDIYVMPNREIFDTTDSIEGFGISFVEASACGKPVIGGKSGGAVEAVEDGKSGFLIDPDSVAEFTAAADKLLSNPTLRREIGEYGRQRVEREMDWAGRAEVVSMVER